MIVDAGEVRRRPRVVSYRSVGRRPNFGLSGEDLYLGGGIADAPPKVPRQRSGTCIGKVEAKKVSTGK